MLPDRLIIIFNNRLPTERAHGLQIVKMCEAFGNIINTELWIPTANNHIKKNIYEYYKVKNNFKIKKKWCVNLPQEVFSGGTIYRLRYFTFLVSLLFSRKGKGCIFFTRHPEVVSLLGSMDYKIFFENHNWYESKRKIKKNLFLIKKATGIIVTTQAIQNKFINYDINSDKILVAPNGVDLNQFVINQSKQELRQELNLPLDKKLIIYTGHLYRKKGVYTLAEAGKYLADDFKIIIIGGLPADISALREFSENISTVEILGHKNYSIIPKYLKAADILVITNSSKYDSESRYTCPLKLFEYFASANTIIASDVPAIREFTNESEVVFFKPGNPQNLAKKIKNISQDKKGQELLKNNVKQKGQAYTWSKRARLITSFIQS